MTGRKYPPGTPISPSGWVVASACGRRIVKGGPRTPGACWWCAGPITPPRREWCSAACVDEMTARDPNTLRARARDRDRGSPCPTCGDPRGGYEVDHTVPIIEGGEPWDLGNLRTICEPCHRYETRCLAARRATARREVDPAWLPCERRRGSDGRPRCLAALTDGPKACTCDRPIPRRRKAPPPLGPERWHGEHRTRRAWQIKAIVRVLSWWRRRREHERRIASRVVP